MKRRWEYDFYNWEEVEGKPEKNYYKKLQELTWRFYFRFIKGYKGWFTPCIKCQDTLDEEYIKSPTQFEAIYWLNMKDILCEECLDKAAKLFTEAEELIFGHNDYMPMVELTRSWIDYDEKTEEISQKEYTENKPYKYIEKE